MATNPDFLNKHDKVGIVSPSYHLAEKHLESALALLKSWDLNIVVSDSVKEKHFEFSGSDQIRLASLQEMIDDPETKCIFCARGGYGITRILDKLNFDKFQKRPKWIVGYSDITSLLIEVENLGFSSIHGPMLSSFKIDKNDPSILALKNYLFNSKYEPVVFKENDYNIPGSATGQITGGNLTMLTNNLGTKTEINTDHKLLFIEEIDEKLYKIDRMIVQLKRAGKLDNIQGLIIGYFSQPANETDSFGYTLEEIVLEHTHARGIPIAFNAPIGHELPNYPIPVGDQFKLEVKKGKSVLSQL